MFRVVSSGAKGTAVRSIMRVLFVTAVVGGALEQHASADSVSFRATFGPTASPVNMTYVFDGFDPSLGTLNFVVVHADQSITATGSITNLSQYTGPWTVTVGGSTTVVFTNSAGFSLRSPFVGPIRPLPIPFIAPNTTYFIAPFGDNDVNDARLTPDLAQVFEGGLVTAALQAGASTSVGSPNVDFSSSFTTSTSGSFSVVYNYTPTTISEPDSLPMIAIALAGLIGITQRHGLRPRL
jgi:hypothetical protein